jgi:DNA end-binding protein Ku
MAPRAYWKGYLSRSLVPDETIPKDMLDLAGHIVESKAGHFDPKEFEDQYESALKELLKQNQAGKPIERPQEPKRSNVVNLVDALRQSLEKEASTARKRPAAPSSKDRRAPAKRTARRRKAS